MNRGVRLVGILVLTACSTSNQVGYPIPDVSVDEIKHAFEALGSCEEHQPGIDAGWAVECHASGGQSASVDGGGRDQIAYLHAGGDVSLPETLTWLETLASVSYPGADPEAAVAWVQSHLRDPSCEGTDTHETECSIIIGEARLTLGWGIAPLDVGKPTLVGLQVSRKDNPYY